MTVSIGKIKKKILDILFLQLTVEFKFQLIYFFVFYNENTL